MSGHRLPEVLPLAMSEDEDLAWFERTVSRGRARAQMADWSGSPAWRFRTSPGYMRPAVEGDNAPEEGWHYVCEEDHPDAIPVWRVEPLDGPVWWYRFRRFCRDRHPHHGGYRPCLWGGRVSRRANWLDRLLTGRSVLNFPPDRWYRLGESELRWCHSCRATTPHFVPRPGRTWRGSTCEAIGHGLSKAAPMATDVRRATDG